MHSRLVWDGSMGFTAGGDSGHKIKVDVSHETGGRDEGPRPVELVLFGLGGCSGADVVAILRKMQVDFTKMEIEIFAERAEEHPKRFTDIKIRYRLAGQDLDTAKVKRAIELSLEKYCSVAASLNANIGYEMEIE